jgi:integrase
LYVEWYEGERRRARNLRHTDRERAKAEAYDHAAKLLCGEVAKAEEEKPGPLTLGVLFDNYLAEVTPGKATARHNRRAVKLFLALWGRHRVVRSLAERDWQTFIRQRRAGELTPEGGVKGRAVRERVIEQDLKLLRAVLNWGTRLKDAAGDFLLPADPLRGLKIPTEPNPVRTMLLEEDYEKLLAVAPRVDVRFVRELVLCAETGHRLRSVRSLRWTDVDLTSGVVTWPAEFDKIDNQHSTPLSDAALAALKAERGRQGAIAGWVFPGGDSPTVLRSAVGRSARGGRPRARSRRSRDRRAHFIPCAGGSPPIGSTCHSRRWRRSVVGDPRRRWYSATSIPIWAIYATR